MVTSWRRTSDFLTTAMLLLKLEIGMVLSRSHTGRADLARASRGLIIII